MTTEALSSILWERKHTAASAVFCFLLHRLRRRCWILGLIFLCRQLRCCCQFRRPVIATPHPSSSSLNPFHLRRHFLSLWRVVYSSSPDDTSVIVVDSAVQSVKDYLPCGCWLCISSGDVLYLWLLGELVYLTLFVIDTVGNSWGVNRISRDFTRNIQSFGLSSICVVCNINKKQYIQHYILPPLLRGHLRDRNKSGTIAQDNSMQRII